MSTKLLEEKKREGTIVKGYATNTFLNKLNFNHLDVSKAIRQKDC